MAADLGELLKRPTYRNTSETESQPPVQRQRQLRQDEVAHLVEDYVRGADVEDLIVTYGVNRTTVYAHLDRNGIQRRRGVVGKLSIDQVQHALELYRSGHSISVVAPDIGVGEETVRRALRQAGVELRDQSCRLEHQMDHKR